MGKIKLFIESGFDINQLSLVSIVEKVIRYFRMRILELGKAEN